MPDKWKPATKIEQGWLTLKPLNPIDSLVVQSLLGLINEPETDHPLRNDLAEEYTNNRTTFMKNAKEFTKKFAERR